MTGFDSFIYMLGTLTFAFMITSSLFYLVYLIERPSRRGRK